MPAMMIIQVANRGETHKAYLAFVGTISRMHAKMHCIITFLEKLLPTIRMRTNVLFFNMEVESVLAVKMTF